MKQMQNLKMLTFCVTGLGVLGLVLRKNLYIHGVDVFNLLVQNHPLELGLWLVTALTAGLVFFGVRGCTTAPAGSFAASFAAAVGHILLASGILLTVLPGQSGAPGVVAALWKYTGILAAPLLVYGGLCRSLGRQVNFLVYVVSCVFFVFHLVGNYQSWCSNPQLQDYVFAFTAALGLMFFAYHLAAMAVGMGNRRTLTAVGMATVYLCLVAMADLESLFLYLGGAVWAGTALLGLEEKSAQRETAGDGDVPA